METAITALAVALFGMACVAGVYRSHAKALTRMVSEAHAERRAEVEKSAELIAAMHGGVQRLTSITDRARTNNGRDPR